MSSLTPLILGSGLGVLLYIIPGAVIFNLPETASALGIAFAVGLLIGICYQYLVTPKHSTSHQLVK
jgi:hypothetical protein